MNHIFRCFQRFAAFAAVVAVPSIGWGHPGHGADDSGVAHYVSEPVHALPLGMIAAALILAVAVIWAAGQVADWYRQSH